MNQPVHVNREFAQSAYVASMNCTCGCGLLRLVHLPTGVMLIVSPNPATLFQLTHEFHLEAVKRTGALVG